MSAGPRWTRSVGTEERARGPEGCVPEPCQQNAPWHECAEKQEPIVRCNCRLHDMNVAVDHRPAWPSRWWRLAFLCTMEPNSLWTSRSDPHSLQQASPLEMQHTLMAQCWSGRDMTKRGSMQNCWKEITATSSLLEWKREAVGARRLSSLLMLWRQQKRERHPPSCADQRIWLGIEDGRGCWPSPVGKLSPLRWFPRGKTWAGH